jgi:hypothetical protein
LTTFDSKFSYGIWSTGFKRAQSRSTIFFVVMSLTTPFLNHSSSLPFWA